MFLKNLTENLCKQIMQWHKISGVSHERQCLDCEDPTGIAANNCVLVSLIALALNNTISN